MNRILHMDTMVIESWSQYYIATVEYSGPPIGNDGETLSFESANTVFRSFITNLLRGTECTEYILSPASCVLSYTDKTIKFYFVTSVDIFPDNTFNKYLPINRK